MFKRISETIHRQSLAEAYVDNQVEFLVRTKGINKQEAQRFVTGVVKQKVKVPTVKVVETIKPGVTTTKCYSLSIFLNNIKDKILTPSGSVYVSTKVKRSVVAILIAEFMKERKAVKKEMFKFKAIGDYAMTNIKNALQNAIKVVLNSLPGSYGFPSVIFFDKGCYNGITSSGRLLISTAFTCCEQVLGGNLPLFSIEEAINLIILAKTKGPDDERIASTMLNHRLKWVTAEEVTEYFQNSLKRYTFVEDLHTHKEFQTLLQSCSKEQLQFLWYHSNLTHVCFHNDAYFKKKITEAFNISTVDFSTIEFSEELWWGLNEELVVIATTSLGQELGGSSIADLAKLPEKAVKVIAVYNQIKTLVDGLEDVFNTFIYHDIVAQKVLTRSSMQRESVVISDTDSVIYTVARWAAWFTNNPDTVIQESYNIAALATYWLIRSNADAMAKFAISAGAIGEDVDLIQMKSEYMYTSMLLFDVKKVYAALIAIQEGVVFNQLLPEIKGAAIRGVGASPKAKLFAKEFLINEVLEPTLNGSLSALDLIDKVVDFEHLIRKNLSQGGLDFLPIISVGTKERYVNCDRSVYFYAKAWNAIFAGKYERVNLPNKLPKILINTPTKEYFGWLQTTHPEIHDRFVAFIKKEGKVPAAFVMDPLCGKIPEELMPLLDIKALIYFNMNPTYLVLSSLNIPIGHPKKHLLLSDIYERNEQPVF